MRGSLLRGLGWFVLANAVLYKLTTLWYAHLLEQPQGAARLFRWLADVSHWPALAGALVGLPALALVLLWPRPRAVWTLAVLAATGAAFLLLADAGVYAQYRMHLGGYVWGILFGGAGRETLFAASAAMWTLLAAIVGGLAALEAGLAWACWRYVARPRRLRAGRYVFAAWLAAFLGANLLHAWADAAFRTDITAQDGIFPFFQPLTAKRKLHRWGLVDSEPPPGYSKAPTLAAAGARLQYPQAPMECAPGARQNVLLVVVDTWRSDTLDPRYTPAIDRFGRDATVFARHVSGSNATRYSIFTVFYGLPGSYWPPVLQSRTPPVLMQEFVRQGYDLAILGSAPLVYPEFDRTVFGGIEGLRLRTPGDRPAERDRRITADMIEFLDKRKPGDKPFFGFLWYDSVHSYDVPDDAPQPFQPSLTGVNYLALRQGYDPLPYLNRYRNALRFVDGEIGRVLDALRRRGLADDTLVIVTGDHGEEFNDTGKNYWGHNGNFSPYQLQVPLLIRGRGWDARRVDYLTSHYDLAPTLLTEVLGCRNPPEQYSIGRPLRQTEGRRSFVPVFDYSEMGIYQPDRVTVITRYGTFPVYDHRYERLDAAADPAAVGGVMHDLIRFSQSPASRPAGAAAAAR
ncbi:MAG: DUF3413 domain-containing protein [Gammaproteobacteria bacterium]|nr:DUF3413 domain-containing protein [Gammaproteobacteria bacterium]